MNSKALDSRVHGNENRNGFFAMRNKMSAQADNSCAIVDSFGARENNFSAFVSQGCARANKVFAHFR